MSNNGKKSKKRIPNIEVAEAALKNLKNHYDFSTLAQSVSEDVGTKGMGGDLGCFGRKKNFVPEFTAAAFALKTPGEFSPLVKTDAFRPGGNHCVCGFRRTAKDPWS